MLNSRNLKLLSSNGRENTGNFPSLDFLCDMNNRKATGRHRLGNGDTQVLINKN
jgi:hypothetical protein